MYNKPTKPRYNSIKCVTALYALPVILNLVEKNKVRNLEAHFLVGCINYCISRVCATIVSCVLPFNK